MREYADETLTTFYSSDSACLNLDLAIPLRTVQLVLRLEGKMKSYKLTPKRLKALHAIDELLEGDRYSIANLLGADDAAAYTLVRHMYENSNWLRSRKVYYVKESEKYERGGRNFRNMYSLTSQGQYIVDKHPQAVPNTLRGRPVSFVFDLGACV